MKLNMSSGKDSTTECAFSEKHWGEKTRKLIAAAKRRTTAQLKDIVKEARTFSIVVKYDPDALSNAGSEDEFKLICRCFFLLIVSGTTQQRLHFPGSHLACISF